MNGRKFFGIVMCSLGGIFLLLCIARIIMFLVQPNLDFTGTSATTESSETEKTKKTQSSSETSSEGYVCPVDFETLQSYNPDIYAWIRVSGTDIDYAVVQSPDDDTYYMNHNSDLKLSSSGALFTEHEYNNTEFSDQVTVIYGHQMVNGSMFGNLQLAFSNEGFFNTNPVIDIYMPDKCLKFQVFAAVPYSNEHILYYNDFSKQKNYNKFLKNIKDINDNDARINEDLFPEDKEQLIILSTCLSKNRYERYIVIGKLIYDSSVDG